MTAATDLVTPVPRPADNARSWLRLVPPTDADPFVQQQLPLPYLLAAGLEADPVSDAMTVHDWDAVADVPAPDGWAGRFLQALVEVIGDQRPLSQLARWTSPAVYAHVGQVRAHVGSQQRDVGRKPARQQVASVHVCQISDVTAEVAARIVGARRSRALAARLEYRRGRWTCTALTLG